MLSINTKTCTVTGVGIYSNGPEVIVYTNEDIRHAELANAQALTFLEARQMLVQFVKTCYNHFYWIPGIQELY